MAKTFLEHSDALANQVPIIHSKKSIGTVFQSSSLFPWLTVEENIAFGLNLKGQKAAAKDIIEYYLNLTNLIKFRHFYPNNLSGGMQQRVAIARALAISPEILVMDEPFAALDYFLRMQFHQLITDIFEKENKTIFFITHDISEALLLSDRIFIMSKRPMTVKKTIEIPFKRPRDLSLRYSQEFANIEKEILMHIENYTNVI